MKASIIIVNYNDKLRVTRAIQSALDQTCKEVEVIMVDDGSDNETRKLYRPFKDKINLVQLERTDLTARTPSRAFNAGIKAAKGEYISVLGCDNYYKPNFVEDMLKYNNDVLFCSWEIVGLVNQVVDIDVVWDAKVTAFENYLTKTCLDHQCMLIKKSVIDKVGMYDTRLPRSQDCDYIVRTWFNTQDWQHVPKRLFVFEKHEADQTKVYASVHGKTLWSLKNNINIGWLLPRLNNDAYAIMSYYKGIYDFMNSKEWAKDYNSSEFKILNTEHNKVLKRERSEVVSG